MFEITYKHIKLIMGPKRTVAKHCKIKITVGIPFEFTLKCSVQKDTDCSLGNHL